MADVTDYEVEALVRDLARLRIGTPRKVADCKLQDRTGGLSAQLQKHDQKHIKELYGGYLPGLPGELKNQILKMIPRQRDRAALLRVCKHLHALMLPIVYHTVVLKIADAHRLNGFLGSNPGHQHLRHLTIVPNGDDGVLRDCMLRLIAALPHDVLVTFHCDASPPQLRQLFVTLASNQETLENAQLIGLGGRDSLDDATFRTHLLRLQQQKAVTMFAVISPTPPIDARCFTPMQEAQTLGWSRCLRSLEYAGGTGETDDRSPMSHSGMPGIIWMWLQMDCPFEKCECGTVGSYHGKFKCPGPGAPYGTDAGAHQDKLNNVVLHRVIFDKPFLLSQTYGRLNCASIGRLTTLVLQDCRRCSDLIDIIASTDGKICLKRLVVLESRYTWQGASVALMGSLGVLLRRFSGLRTLAIAGTTDIAPHQDAIVKHSETLRELYIDSPSSLGSGRPFDWYRDICGACRELEQVSLPMPVIQLGNAGRTSMQWTPLDEPASKAHTQVGLFRMCLDQLLRLPKLVTLRILWVRWDRSWTRPSTGMEIANSFASLLLRIFKAWGHTELSLIALGQEEYVGEIGQGIMQCYLVRNMRQCWRDDGLSGLMRVDKSAAMEEEPRSEILDIQRNSRGLLRFPRTE